MIEETKNYVEANLPGAKVRYGDTDSVMVVSTLLIERVKKLSSTVGNLVRKPQRSVALFQARTTWSLEGLLAILPVLRYANSGRRGKDDQMNMDCMSIKGLQVVRETTSYHHVREVV